MTKRAKNIKKMITRRVVFIYILALVFGSAIVAQTFRLMVFERSKWENTKGSPIQMKPIAAKRGDIISRDGNMLATSVPWYEVVIDMRAPDWDEIFQSKNDSIKTLLDAMSRGISKYTNQSPAMVLTNMRRIHEKNGQFMFHRQFIYREYNELAKLPILRNGRYKTGLRHIAHAKRVQPYGELAKRTIGSLSHDGFKGHNGFEKAFNEYLAGKSGEGLMQKIGGAIWMPIDESSTKEPENGFDMVTTLNMDFQDIVHNALLKQLHRTRSHHGCAVLMEVETGEVLAIANLSEDINGYEEDYNYAVGERTEPGSTMKLASFMAAIEDGYLKLTDSVDTENGIFHYNNIDIKDTKEDGYGKLSAKDVFKVSSNIGMVKLILRHYEDIPEEFIDRLYTFNINKMMGLEIPGEPPPIIKYPGDSLWWAGSLAQISYGYEIKFTAMQILTFYNAIANNGKMVRPRFSKALSKEGKIKKRFNTDVIDNSICSRSTLKKARELLESVTDDGYITDNDGKKIFTGLKGTAYNIKSKTYKIAGKTGTSQIADEDRGYGEQDGMRDYQASFVGYFPADNPKYSCIVVINSPRHISYYGNIVAGEVFKEIADKVYARTYAYDHNQQPESGNSLPYSLHGNRAETLQLFDEFDIPVNDNELTSDWVLTYNTDSVINLKNRFITDNNLMPNVKGMGLKDALYLLENRGLKVSVEGFGMVKQQYPKPNKRIRKGEPVKLVLNKNTM